MDPVLADLLSRALSVFLRASRKQEMMLFRDVQSIFGLMSEGVQRVWQKKKGKKSIDSKSTEGTDAVKKRMKRKRSVLSFVEQAREKLQ